MEDPKAVDTAVPPEPKSTENRRRAHEGFVREVNCSKPTDPALQLGILLERAESDLSASFTSCDSAVAKAMGEMSRPLPEHGTQQEHLKEPKDFQIHDFVDRLCLRIIERHGAVGRLSVAALIDRFQIREYLLALRNYLLLNAGDFSDSLAESLFEVIARTPGPAWPTLRDVAPCLETAIRKSGRKDPLLSCFSLVMHSPTAGVFRPHSEFPPPDHSLP